MRFLQQLVDLVEAFGRSIGAILVHRGDGGVSSPRPLFGVFGDNGRWRRAAAVTGARSIVNIFVRSGWHPDPMRYTNLDGSQRVAGVGELLRWQLGLHEEALRPRSPGTGVAVPVVDNDGEAW